jgi:hypothetical protein
MPVPEIAAIVFGGFGYVLPQTILKKMAPLPMTTIYFFNLP